jgi:hypothetical protein
MRNGFLTSVVLLVASAPLAFAQPGSNLFPSVADPTRTPAGAGDQTSSLLPGTLPNPVPPIIGEGPPEGAAWQTGGHLSLSTEFLYWWIKNPRVLPPLINSQPTLSGEGTFELAGGGDGRPNVTVFPGARINLGYWGDECQSYGAETSLILVARQQIHFTDDRCPVIVRPFCSANTLEETALLVAFPGIASGSVQIDYTSGMWGWEGNGAISLVNDPIISGVRLSLLVGLRYLEMTEDLTIDSTTAYNLFIADPAFAANAGSVLHVHDDFLARNQFFGPQLGIDARFYLDLGAVDFRAKLAAGANAEQVKINGSQLIERFNGPTTVSRGGLLALATNIGSHRKYQMDLVPEFDMNWLIKFGQHFNLNLGGSILYVNRVVRPGDQIDRTLDVNLIPNFIRAVPVSDRRPGLPFFQSDWYAIGLSAGLEVTW